MGHAIRKHRPTEALPQAAADALRRLELAFTPTIVVNYDHFGSLWGHSTTEETVAEIAEARTEGATVEEWNTSDRNGQPLCIARVIHPKYGTDIRAFTSTSRLATTA